MSDRPPRRPQPGARQFPRHQLPCAATWAYPGRRAGGNHADRRRASPTWPGRTSRRRPTKPTTKNWKITARRPGPPVGAPSTPGAVGRPAATRSRTTTDLSVDRRRSIAAAEGAADDEHSMVCRWKTWCGPSSGTAAKAKRLFIVQMKPPRDRGARVIVAAGVTGGDLWDWRSRPPRPWSPTQHPDHADRPAQVAGGGQFAQAEMAAAAELGSARLRRRPRALHVLPTRGRPSG